MTEKVSLYGRKEHIAATPEAYVEALDSARREDIGRLHARIRDLDPGVIDEVILASAANDGQHVTY